MHIRQRSRHFSPSFRVESNALSAEGAVDTAQGWRDNVNDPLVAATFPCLALAAYFQSIADRKAHTEPKNAQRHSNRRAQAFVPAHQAR